MRVVFTGGGSGGHTMPAVAMIEFIKKYCSENKIDYNFLCIGSKDGVERDIVTKKGIDYKSVSTGKLRRYLSFKNFTDMFRIIKGFFQSLKIISNFKPDLIFSTGGFVSVPVVIAAKRKKISIVIHEQTIDAGLANKIASKFADKVCITFSESKKYFPESKVVVTGIPLRDEVFSGSIESARSRFGFDSERPTVFFTGGGLGCHILNEVSLEIIDSLLDKVNIIFQTGKNSDFDIMRDFRETLTDDKKKKFFLYDFIGEEIGDIYSIADLIVARSGAGTVNEILARKTPAIFIPLAIATNNEQYKNALVVTQYGGAVILEEKELTANKLNDLLNKILFTEKLSEMKNNLSTISFSDGRENILKVILDELQSV